MSEILWCVKHLQAGEPWGRRPHCATGRQNGTEDFCQITPMLLVPVDAPSITLARDIDGYYDRDKMSVTVVGKPAGRYVFVGVLVEPSEGEQTK